ncbi:hypothetical protein SAMN04488096_104105 [Mesonia phycicola]|uniref:DUF4258 domain-containing protein n=1 Tax=Mesonia phycicola TaxID=579105 RepID=A0A1M6DPL1_9FLAO|nr:hypothetical protein [Mesonia phycicola]SHI75186.1 hypothetical protein SAMN04488096_104105 [Mesonia phycicola]
MKFIHRLGYYLGGFSIGIVILIFFLSGKKTSCDYGPNARVLKNIRSKHKTYTNTAKNQLEEFQLDSIFIDNTLQQGDVLFDESKTSLDSCNIYVVESEKNNAKYKTSFQNCDSLVTILNISYLKK